MHLHVLTIALNAAPWLAAMLVELNRYPCAWSWSIIEGAAVPVRDTSWMGGQFPSLSRDGTHEFLRDLTHHPCITVVSRPSWNGKVEMCNAGLPDQPCCLLQADSDELWTATQMQGLVSLVEGGADIVQVKMRYFVGPHIRTEGRYGDGPNEWIRAWRFRPGMTFDSHEPPLLAGNKGKLLTKQESVKTLGEIDHYAWATSKQVFAKGLLYRYPAALEGWTKLQSAPLPCDLQPYMPWASGKAKSSSTSSTSMIGS